MLNSATWYFELENDVCKKIVYELKGDTAFIDVIIYDDAGIEIKRRSETFKISPPFAVRTFETGIEISSAATKSLKNPETF